MTNITSLTKFKKVTYPGVISNSYMISDSGEIYSVLTNKFLKPYQDKDGYFKIGLKIFCPGKIENRYSNIFIHRLVAWEWVNTNRDFSLVVDHIDGNKQNNHASNLEWVTVKENTNRADALGLKKRRGEYCNTNRYKESMIHEICKMFQDGLNNMDIWKKYSGKNKIDPNNKDDSSLYNLIYRLRKREIWPDVTSKYQYESKVYADKIWMPRENSFFNENEVRKICDLYCNKGLGIEEIANTFGITRTNENFKKYYDRIGSIVRGDTWKEITKDYPGIVRTETRVHTNYKNLDDKVLELIHVGKSDAEIIQTLNDPKIVGDTLIRAIKRRIKKFREIKDIPETEDITIKDIEKISKESWAANQ